MEKEQIAAVETSFESRKEPMKLCNICGEIRNEPQKEKNLSRKKNGK